MVRSISTSFSGTDHESKYERALRRLGIDPAFLSQDAGMPDPGICWELPTDQALITDQPPGLFDVDRRADT